MAEHIIGREGVCRLVDEADTRNLIFVEPGGDVYRIPLSFDGAREIGEMLVKDPEEVAQATQAQQAARRLIVPQHNGSAN